MISNVSIAQSILQSACEDSAMLENVTIEGAVPGMGAAYEGACALKGTRVLHVYLCDDEPDQPIWMTDTMDMEIGDVNPQPLTGEALIAALAWLDEA